MLSVHPKSDRIVVEGVNMKWKHVRKSQQQPQGGRTQREYPLHSSNVAFAMDGKAVRLGTKIDGESGKKLRVTRPGGKPVEAA